MRSIWGFVYNFWDGVTPLAEAILKFFGSGFFNSAIGAVEAVLAAGTFFVGEGLTPHTDYQFSMPVEGSPLTSWQLALSHLAGLVGQTLA